jgi:hypothetical protein
VIAPVLPGNFLCEVLRDVLPNLAATTTSFSLSIPQMGTTLLKFALALGSLGNVRTRTVRA